MKKIAALLTAAAFPLLLGIAYADEMSSGEQSTIPLPKESLIKKKGEPKNKKGKQSQTKKETKRGTNKKKKTAEKATK